MQYEQQADMEKQAEQLYLDELAREDHDAGVPEPTTAETQKDEDVIEEREAERVEVFEGYTKDELNAALAEIPKLRTSIERTNGTYGQRLADLQKTIDALKKGEAKQEPDQKPLKGLSRTKESYPELADQLATDIDELVEERSRQHISAFEQQIQERLDGERQAFQSELRNKEVSLLKRQHPDYIDVAGYDGIENGVIKWNNPAFGTWAATLPQDVQSAIINGNDANTLIDILSDFKKLQKKKQVTNLEKAIHHKSTSASGASSLDDEERMYQEELLKEGY